MSKFLDIALAATQKQRDANSKEPWWTFVAPEDMPVVDQFLKNSGMEKIHGEIPDFAKNNETWMWNPMNGAKWTE